jgi:hypothetical protein
MASSRSEPSRSFATDHPAKKLSNPDHDAGGSTILYATVSIESLELVKFLIDKKGADVNSRTEWRGTPLQAAVLE